MGTIQRVRTVFTGVAGSPYYNNIYFDSAGTLADAQAAVDRVDAAWTTITSIMNIALLGAVEAEVPQINDENGEITGVFATTGGVVDPTNAGEPLPWATQGLVRLLTNSFVEGRRVRGRIFIPGLGEAASDAGVPNANTITSLNNLGTTLISGGAPHPVIWSRPIEADPDAVPPVEGRLGSSHLVTLASTWNKWSVLRSRRD